MKEPLPPRPAEFLTPPSRSELRDSQTGKVTPPADLNGPTDPNGPPDLNGPADPGGDDDETGDAEQRAARARARSSRHNGPPTRRSDETGSRRRRSR